MQDASIIFVNFLLLNAIEIRTSSRNFPAAHKAPVSSMKSTHPFNDSANRDAAFRSDDASPDLAGAQIPKLRSKGTLKARCFHQDLCRSNE